MSVLVAGKSREAIVAESEKRLFSSFYITKGKKTEDNAPILAYKIHFSLPRAYPMQIGYDEVVTVCRIPSAYGRFIDNYWAGFPKSDSGEVGHIEYKILESKERTVAKTHRYNPKQYGYVSKYTRGLGYFLEMITTHDLEKLGVTHVTTSVNPSSSRKRQLKGAGLPVRKEVPIKEWVLGLARGFRLWNDKFTAPEKTKEYAEAALF